MPILFGTIASSNQQARADTGAIFPLAAITVSSAVSSITFSSIPSTYTHLQIRGIGRTDRSAENDGLGIQFNGDTSTNYSRHNLNGNGSATSADYGVNANYMQVNRLSGGTATANNFATFVIDILDYKNTNKPKTLKALGGYDNNSTGLLAINSGNWRDNSAINEVRLFSINGTNFVQYSSFALYGIKGA